MTGAAAPPSDPPGGPREPALPAADASPAVRWLTRIGVALILCATLALVAHVRLRFAATPLERDEGEYALAGQLILEGIAPYELVYNMKFPGTYYAYAALMALFGQTPWGIRVGLLVVNVATLLLLFALGRRLAGTLAAGVGAAAFAILTLDRWSMGPFAHATHFTLLPALAGLLALHAALRRSRAGWFVAAGFLTGLAIVMKQHALCFGVLAVGLAIDGARAPTVSALRRGAWVAAGSAAALALLAATVAAQGVFGRFWFWTFEYAAAYVSQVGVAQAPAAFAAGWEQVTRATAGLWYAGLAGLALLFATRWTRESRVWIASWLAASLLTVAPGFFFRPHYFVPLMPAAALLVGVAVASLDRVLARFAGAGLARVLSLLLFVGVAGLYVQRESAYLFRISELELLRSIYRDDPFAEAPEIGRYLEAHTAPEERIAVLGSEPEILFYARRKPATGYIWTYPLMERQPFAARMQEEMQREIEAAQPAHLVLVGLGASWGVEPGSDVGILEWAAAYATRCYERVGIADVDPERGSTVVWDTDAAGYRPRTRSLVMIYRRSDECAGASAPQSSRSRASRPQPVR